MSLQLRPHQEQAITQLRSEIKRGSLNPVLAAPCSMGKTFIACEIMRRAAANNKKSVFFVDRNKLISQTTDTLDAMGLDYSVRQGDQFWLYDPDKLIQVVSIQTAARRNQMDYDLAIIDECHTIHKSMAEQMKRLNAVPHIGLSATPFTKSLGNVFSSLVTPATPRDLIAGGYLAPTDYYGGRTPDVSQVKLKRLSSGGVEYDEKSLEKTLMNDKLLAGDIIENYRRVSGSQRKRALLFAPSVAHSKQMCLEFNEQGIPAVHIDGTMDSELRKAIYDDFKDGLYQVMCNSKLCTYGFDDPGIEIIIDITPSKSLIRNIQVAGRVWRTAPGKERGIYLDHAGNISRMGAFPEDLIPSRLDTGERNYQEKRLVKERKEIEPATCPQCTRLFKVKCLCGYERPKLKQILTDTQTLKKIEQSKAQEKFLAGLQLYAHEKGYKRGFIYHTFKEKFKVEPPENWPRPATKLDQEVKNYITYLRIKRAKSGTDTAAA